MWRRLAKMWILRAVLELEASCSPQVGSSALPSQASCMQTCLFLLLPWVISAAGSASTQSADLVLSLLLRFLVRLHFLAEEVAVPRSEVCRRSQSSVVVLMIA